MLLHIPDLAMMCRRCILSVSLHIYGNTYICVKEWNPTMRSSIFQFVANACFRGENLRISKCQWLCLFPHSRNKLSEHLQAEEVGFFPEKRRLHGDFMVTFQYPGGSYWKARERLCIRNCNDSKWSNVYKLKGGNLGSSAEFNKTQKMYYFIF